MQRSQICQIVSIEFQLAFKCVILAKCLSEIPHIIIRKLLVLLAHVVKLLDGGARLLLRDQSLPQEGQVSHKSANQATHFYSFLRVFYIIFPH